MVYLLTTGVSAPRRSPSATISRVSSWHVSALLVSLLKNCFCVRTLASKYLVGRPTVRPTVQWDGLP